MYMSQENIKPSERENASGLTTDLQNFHALNNRIKEYLPSTRPQSKIDIRGLKAIADQNPLACILLLASDSRDELPEKQVGEYRLRITRYFPVLEKLADNSQPYLTLALCCIQEESLNEARIKKLHSLAENDHLTALAENVYLTAESLFGVRDMVTKVRLDAQRRLAKFYAQSGGEAMDEKTAFYFYEAVAASNHSFPRDWHELGLRYYYKAKKIKAIKGRKKEASGLYKQAMQLFKQAAGRGYSHAQHAMGLCYRDGQGV